MISKETVKILYRDYINSLEDGFDTERTNLDRVTLRDVINAEVRDLNCIVYDEIVDVIINILEDEGYIKE